MLFMNNKINRLQNSLDNYAKSFEQLTPENLKHLLPPLLSENIIFQDPFNRVIGISKVTQIFEQMFESLEVPKFTIVHTAINNEIGYIHWTFRFKLKNEQEPRFIDGLSQIKFNETGLVDQHIDYWDSAEYFYKKIPLIGWIIQKIANKLKVVN